MEKKEMYLNTTPNSNDMWKEFGGNYETAERRLTLLENSFIKWSLILNGQVMSGEVRSYESVVILSFSRISFL